MVRTWMIVSAVALGLGSIAQARPKHCVVRVHAQTDAHDGSTFATPVTTPLTGRNVFIEKIPTISERDVVAFRVCPAKDGSLGVLFQLNDHGRLALETLSTEHRGSTLLVFVNGRALTELMVDRRVSDGKLYIPAGLSAADIQLMEKDWPPPKGGTRGRAEARPSETNRQQ